jgi:hypothetical protein
MKRTTLVFALLFVFGAAAVHADRWVSSRPLPKAIDYPIVRKKVKEDHKQDGHRQRHRPMANP